jgi:hypothetical protein
LRELPYKNQSDGEYDAVCAYLTKKKPAEPFRQMSNYASLKEGPNKKQAIIRLS